MESRRIFHFLGFLRAQIGKRPQEYLPRIDTDRKKMHNALVLVISITCT